MIGAALAAIIYGKSVMRYVTLFSCIEGARARVTDTL